MLRSIFALLLLAPCCLPGAPTTVKGSATATAPLRAATAKLQAAGVEVTIDASATTTSAIDSVASGTADLAVGTRPVSSEERAAHPDQRLVESTIGVHLLALVVSHDLWDAGVRVLEKEQVRRIYEKEVTNWKQLGGPDREIKFLNPAQGQGVWETFVTWLYGDMRRAPLGSSFETVSGGEQTRSVVEFTAGSLSVMPTLWVDDRGTHALSLKLEGGEVLPPTLAAALQQQYPLARQLTLISSDRPFGAIKRIVDFMRGPAAKEFLKKGDFVPVAGDTEP